jgi:hypothetical protein
LSVLGRREAGISITLLKENATHLSSFISMMVDLGETDLALDNLNPSSLDGRLWLFG